MSWVITPTSALVDDPDAMTYLAAVEQTDGQALEPAVRLAVNAFVKGCKADGIWPAIKASCILAGARTLNGALVPLVGAAPTSVNFVDADYNRKTGLMGNGTSKYLNSNRNNNADIATNFHLSCYRTRSSASNQAYLGARLNSNATGGKFVWSIGATPSFVVCPSTDNSDNAGSDLINVATFHGLSRNNLNTATARISGANNTITRTSGTAVSANIFIFAANNGGAELYTSARLAFYSIGESLDLALLDTRVTTLINAFAAAIP